MGSNTNAFVKKVIVENKKLALQSIKDLEDNFVQLKRAYSIDTIGKMKNKYARQIIDLQIEKLKEIKNDIATLI